MSLAVYIKSENTSSVKVVIALTLDIISARKLL